MEDSIKVWLFDILNAIMEIDTFFMDGPNTFSDFQADIKTKRAVERNIEIIGEAMNRILKAAPSISLSDTRNIVNARNRIAHGYDTVSDEVIWNIVHQHIPILKAEIEQLLSK